MGSSELFEKVLEMCGFSSVLGPGILRRALKDQGVSPETATTDEYRSALPRLQMRMRAYLPAAEAASRARRIAGMLAHVDGELESEDEEDWSRFGRSVQILQEVRRRLAESSEITLEPADPADSERPRRQSGELTVGRVDPDDGEKASG